MEQTSWQNDGTFHLLRRVLQQHNTLWRERLPGLTPVQFSVLLSLAHLPGADQQQIGAASAVEKTTMTNLLVRMEKCGLVSRTIHPEDGRRYRLHLTKAGHDELRHALPVVRMIRDDCLAVISTNQHDTLRQILGALAHPHSRGDLSTDPNESENQP